MDLINFFERNYSNLRVANFESKYLPFFKLNDYLNSFHPNKTIIGKSFLGRNIYKLSLGKGKTRILVWSQMHGNESTGTRAMFDVLNFLKSETFFDDVLNEITLDFIPMLNPDGAELYTRRTATGVDLNRDFNQKASPEIKLLISQVQENNYDYLLNLHDQRTIFNVGETKLPATLSFLAPSGDFEQTINETRKKTMLVISEINKALQKLIPGQIGRYTSEFYPNATGDNFTKMGIPTILFEAGHFPKDYNRNETRKFNALAILLALSTIATNKDEINNYEDYFEIPENGTRFLDLIIRNVVIKSSNNQIITDLGIQIEDKLNNNKKIESFYKIVEIGDLSHLFGHEDLNANSSVYKGFTNEFPRINDLSDFCIKNLIRFEKGKLINL